MIALDTNVRVINAGLHGYTSYESLVNFQFRVLDLEPDMIIIYHAFNDTLMRLVWPPLAYRGDNSGAKRPAPGLDAPVPLLERSTAIRIVMIRFGLAESPGALEHTFVKAAPTFHGFSFMRQKERRVGPRGIYTRINPMQMLNSNPPKYFERNLEHMLVIAKHRGVQPVLATFAYSEAGRDASSSSELRHGMDQANRIVLRVGGEFEVPVFDFAAAFPKDPTLFVGGVHVNARGARLKAEMFADFLVDSALIPKP